MSRRAHRRLALTAILVTIGCGPGSATTTATSDAANGCETEACASSSATSGSSATSAGPTSAETVDSASSTASTGSTTGASTSESGTCEPATRPEPTDCDFICRLDEPSGPACNVWTQDCPCEQKCAAYSYYDNGIYDSTRCFNVQGDGQLGDECTANPLSEGGDDCAKGLMCWFLDEDNVGECIALCDESPEGCPDDTFCPFYSEQILNLCYPTCDPLIQDCGDGRTCLPWSGGDDEFVCYLDTSAGLATEGTPCTFFHSCSTGLVCANESLYPAPACADSNGCCAPFCDLNEGDGGCQGLSVEGATCVALFEMAPAGHEDVGICGLL